LGQKAEDVFKLLKNQLVIIEVFCTQLETIASSVDWRNGEEISSNDFRRLSQKCKAIGTISKVFTDGKTSCLLNFLTFVLFYSLLY